MTLEKNVQAKSQPKANFSEEEDKDLRIGVLIGEQLLEQGGLDVIQKAVDSSSDPAQVIGQFFVHMIQHLQEKMPPEVKLSPRIYLSKNGWLEQMMDYVIEKIELDPKVADRAEVYVATTAQQLAKAKPAAPGQEGADPQQPTQPQPEQQQAPAMPMPAQGAQ